MTAWRDIHLGDGMTVRHGFAFKGEYFRDTGQLVVLTPGNFLETGGFKSKRGAEKYYEGPVPAGYLLERGDVVIAMTEQSPGLLGSSATIPEDDRFLHNQRIGRIQISNAGLLDTRFVYHMMNTAAVRQQIQATATGAKVRHTAPERIATVRVRVPPVAAQRVIASVLDSLDRLAENNWRRVQVLEKIVRTTYREWFVRFRFPGHEDVPLIDSPVGPIPEEWHPVTLGEVIELKYGKALKADARNGGDVAVVGSSGIVGWHDQGLVAGPAIVLGRKGNVGSVTWIDGPCWPIDTTYFVESALPLRFLVEQLRRTEFLNTHAAVPGLSRDLAYSKPFLRPPDRLMVEFAQVSEVLASESSVLQQQNECIASMRDLLLPKLVTGQIDISRMNLDALTEGAVA